MQIHLVNAKQRSFLCQIPKLTPTELISRAQRCGVSHGWVKLILSFFFLAKGATARTCAERRKTLQKSNIK